MANIFLQLNEFRFKKETLEEIAGSANSKSLQKVINEFYSANKTQNVDYANFLIDLLQSSTTKEGIKYCYLAKEKLLIALVYFIVNVDEKFALTYLEKVHSGSESVLLKVKFYSFVFKSSTNQNIKKDVIKKTVQSIENEQNVSSFAGLIEHFDEILATLTLTEQEAFEIYLTLISYLEKHPVYRKVCSVYVIRSLKKVSESNAQSKETNQLIIKAIKYGIISDDALALLNHQHLKKNELFSILEVLLTGDFEKLDLSKIKNLEKEGVIGEDVLRRMKVEAIPRLLTNVKNASYDQVAQRLDIKKSEVESYIIDAIKEGIIKAKLDEFQETVIITRVNLRALRQDERTKLQKDITDLCSQLSEKANKI